MATEDDIRRALATVRYPGYSRDIASFGLIKKAGVEQGRALVDLELTSHNPETAAALKASCEAALLVIPGVTAAHVHVHMPAASGASAPNSFSQQNRIANVKRIVAIASGKGGVGKSTCSVNLACALTNRGYSVGLLDCDIYGPSIPLMMGVHEKPQINSEEKMVPPERFGVKLMSMGFIVEGDTPVIWRGPMIMKTIQQFVMVVDWGRLDYLLVDLPPGTGDAQLSLCQTVPLDGGVIVTTPQEASLGVVRKGIGMFEKVNVPILGIIENMSYFTAPGGERVEIFGHGGGRAEAIRRGVDFLGEIPIFTDIRVGGDNGEPVAAVAKESASAKAFMTIADALHNKLK